MRFQESDSIHIIANESDEQGWRVREQVEARSTWLDMAYRMTTDYCL